MSKIANSGPLQLAELNARIVECTLCPRLVQHRRQMALEKRRAYRTHEYWGRPVPSFGDPAARVLILGLAPGAHGSNRTGRPFTGDGSGNFLYPVLYQAGFASQTDSVSREDGMELHDAWISAVVRCAPPANKPLSEEVANCAPYLDEEIAALSNLRVVVCLGKIAFDGYVTHLLRTGAIERRGNLRFSHGVEFEIAPDHFLLATYHPSLQNTNTGKLTAAMFLKIFQRARAVASATASESLLRSCLIKPGS